MTDKQIAIDYKNLCENYSKEVGCYNTFDGSCIKEQCFTYRLLQLLKTKEQECEKLKKINITPDDKIWKTMSITFDNGFVKTEVADMSMAEYSQLKLENTKYKQTLAEIKEIAKNSCCLQPTSTCEEYENCKECSRTSDDETVKQILQKISECEV